MFYALMLHLDSIKGGEETTVLTTPQEERLDLANASVSQPISLKDSTKAFSRDDFDVILTPLELIPGARIVKYLGPINIYFVKEAWAVRNDGKNTENLHVI